MLDFLKYWKPVICCAWRLSWTALIDQSIGAIIRDALFLLGAAALVFCFKDKLTTLHPSVDAAASILDAALWAVALFISIFAALIIFFLFVALFVSPYIIWRDEKASTVSAQTQLDVQKLEAKALALQERGIKAQEEHTAILAAQIEQQEKENNPLLSNVPIEAWLERTQKR